MLNSLNASEHQELLVRRVQMARYAVRSPCFDVLTKPLLDAVTRGTQRVPLLGKAVGLVTDIAEGMQKYYTYVEA